MHRIAQAVTLLSLTVVLSISFNGIAKADLVLTIDLRTQEFDWGGGTVRLPTGSDNNNWGDSSSSVGATISSPLPVYAGNGTILSTLFGFSPDGSSIDRLALGTSGPPGTGATFSGTAAGPKLAVYTAGSFSDFANLSLGSYDLTPEGPWNGNMRIQVVSSVPEPSSLVLVFMVCMAGASTRRR